MKQRRLLIFGTGTVAEIAGYYFTTDSNYELIGFVDHHESARTQKSLMDRPIFRTEVALAKFRQADADFFVAVGYQRTNSVRQKRYEEIKRSGYKCATYISSKASVMTEDVGENCMILENNVLQPFAKIGNNVTMWSGNHLGHHSTIEDHSFISSHVVISGKCKIGRNSFLGVNCCLHDGVEIGEKSVVGAGSIVTKSCEARSVFMPHNTEPRIIHRDII